MKEKPGRGIQCEKHGDRLKLYCKEDEILLCVVCEKSQVHRGHTVVPREEAAQEYREKIAELTDQLQSATEKLHLLEGKEGKHLPERARDTDHKKLKRPTAKTQSPGYERRSFSLERKIATETELQGHKEKKNNRKRVSKKQETKSHVIHTRQSSLDPTIHRIGITTEDAEHIKVDNDNVV
ncbi:tripartite motif-containing protein 6-like [Trachemys scripta elegans]|uniref:tripartite motif-containing protein 6-like n=1 Tax=Trachemys scripta elegans TaxID=31138 RepID=UPI001554A7BE|nr:tripartite motif-containing protein 6-like [Trachemys scripta elegans]